MLCFLKLWLGQHKQLTEAYLHSYLLLLFLPIWVVNKGGLISEVIFTLFPSHPQKLCKITIRCSKFPLQVEKLRKVPSLISQSNSIYLVYFIKISYFFCIKGIANGQRSSKCEEILVGPCSEASTTLGSRKVPSIYYVITFNT